MLSLFKSRYLLKDIIPDGYIDIHNHILAGVDDGSQSPLETSKLIKKMAEINIEGAIATPHTFAKYWNNSPETIKKAFDSAAETAFNKSFLKDYASEYMLDSTLMERIQKQKLLCIWDNFVLIEMPHFAYPVNLFEMLFELKCKNYNILMAHPERYSYFFNDIKKIEQLKAYGISFQLNLMSLTGYYGKKTQKLAEFLLQNDFYNLSGTDIHNEQQIEQFTHKRIHFNKDKIEGLLQKNCTLFKQTNHSKIAEKTTFSS